MVGGEAGIAVPVRGLVSDAVNLQPSWLSHRGLCAPQCLSRCKPCGHVRLFPKDMSWRMGVNALHINHDVHGSANSVLKNPFH